MGAEPPLGEGHSVQWFAEAFIFTSHATVMLFTPSFSRERGAATPRRETNYRQQWNNDNVPALISRPPSPREPRRISALHLAEAAEMRARAQI